MGCYCRKLKKALGIMLFLFLCNMHVGFTAPVTDGEESADMSLCKMADTVRMLKEFGSKQTLQGLIDGKIIITDKLINELLLAKSIGNGQQGSNEELKVFFKNDNRIEFHSRSKARGYFTAYGTIQEIRHDKSGSLIKIKLQKKELKNKGLRSWLISNFSLGFVTALAGSPIDLGDNIKTRVKGNTVYVDFKECLAKSALGQVELIGVKFTDCIIISGAKTYDGYLELDTNLNMPEEHRKTVVYVIKAILAMF